MTTEDQINGRIAELESEDSLLQANHKQTFDRMSEEGNKLKARIDELNKQWSEIVQVNKCRHEQIRGAITELNKLKETGGGNGAGKKRAKLEAVSRI